MSRYSTQHDKHISPSFVSFKSVVMAGLDLPIADDLRHLIYYFLDNDLLSNALFIATRLVAHEPSADATHILSLCYLRLDQLSAAAEHSELFGKTGQHLGCTYVFAKCCLGLGQFKNGIQALEQSKSVWNKTDNWGTYCNMLVFTSLK